MDDEEIKFQMEVVLKKAIQAQLSIPRLSRAYDGRIKPASLAGAISPKSLTGQLSNSVNVKFVEGGQNNLELVVSFTDNDYWYYVDQGRQPGKEIVKRRQARKKNGQFGKVFYVRDYTKYPPLSQILQWVRQRPALQGAGDIDTRAYLASRSIARDGIYGIQFIDAAIKEVTPVLIEMFGDYAETIFDNLTTRITEEQRTIFR
jgi:hypothetical protein